MRNVTQSLAKVNSVIIGCFLALAGCVETIPTISTSSGIQENSTWYVAFAGEIPRGGVYKFARNSQHVFDNPEMKLTSLGCHKKDIGIIVQAQRVWDGKIIWKDGSECLIQGGLRGNYTFQAFEILRKRDSSGQAFSLSEIKKLIGEPIKTEYYSNLIVHQWCKTFQTDSFGVGVFFGERLVKVAEYDVSGAPVGDCSKYARSAIPEASQAIYERNQQVRLEKERETARIETQKLEAERVARESAIAQKTLRLRDQFKRSGGVQVEFRFAAASDTRGVDIVELKGRQPARFVKVEACDGSPFSKLWQSGLVVQDYLITEKQFFRNCKIRESVNSLAKGELSAYNLNYHNEVVVQYKDPYPLADYGVKDCRLANCNPAELKVFREFQQWRASMISNDFEASARVMESLSKSMRVAPQADTSKFKVRCIERNIGNASSISECEFEKR